MVFLKNPEELDSLNYAIKHFLRTLPPPQEVESKDKIIQKLKVEGQNLIIEAKKTDGLEGLLWNINVKFNLGMTYSL